MGDGIGTKPAFPGASTEDQQLKAGELNHAATEVAAFGEATLIQLRSFPVGLRVEPWLRETYPELIDGQVECIHWQLQENVRALSPEGGRSPPAPG